MNSTVLKKALPHIIAVLIFLIVAVVYCRPALEGKVIFQSDMLQYKGMAQQATEWKEKTGHYPLWVENAFSGMPAYTIAMDHAPIHLGWVVNILTLWLPQPVNYFFLACICFYILMAALRINPWIGVLAALAYAYSSYDPVIVVTGHVTKMLAIAYAPGVFAGLWLLFQRRWIGGMALFMLFFALQMSTNHLQIVYYTMIGLGIFTLFYLVDTIRKGQVKAALMAMGLAAVGALIGYGTNALGTLPVQEYSKETMRGGRTELTNTNSKIESKDGLSKEYAFGWSYGIGETMTLVVPNAYGGSNGGKEIGEGSKFAEKLSQEFPAIREEDALNYANGSAYWGAQPFTSGPVYLGAVVCFLAILGLVFVKGWTKWALLTIAIISILLSWGKNLSGLNYFLFDHLPFYNKFRAPAMALVIVQLIFPILAALGLNELFSSTESKADLWKRFLKVAYISGGLLVLLIGFYFAASFSTTNDAQLKEQFVQGKMQQLAQQGKQAGAELQQQAAATGNGLLKALSEDRQSLYGADLLRTFVLILLAAALVAVYLKDKLNKTIVLAGLIIITAFDLLIVGNRYLSADSYVDSADFDSNMTPTPADQQIKNDPDKNFRVFDESSRSPFEDARASFHHNSLGGYSPAKLGLYQDLIENQLSKGNMQVYNMLNTKYFIQRNPQNGQLQPALNGAAFGPCWLVRSIHYVKDGNEEMKALDSINVRDTAIVQQRFAAQVKSLPEADSTASIRLTDNQLDKLIYQFSSTKPQFAVLSEIYYDKGWNAYVDGTKTDYLRVDYVLRGLPVPAGKHTIEFRFEPSSYKTGSMISTWSALLLYLLLIGTAVLEWRKQKARTV
ncbi:MAG: YfhO family protein [Bacteroidetes bacterium]|nr:YfhO family protein [Bacteroidota bacterium]